MQVSRRHRDRLRDCLPLNALLDRVHSPRNNAAFVRRAAIGALPATDSPKARAASTNPSAGKQLTDQSEFQHALRTDNPAGEQEVACCGNPTTSGNRYVVAIPG